MNDLKGSVFMRIQPCTRFGLGNDSNPTEKTIRYIQYVIDAVYRPFDSIELEIKSGASKAVVLNVERDYVLKFPFNGYYDYHNTWRDFKGADSYDEKWNYCKAEIEIYCSIPCEYRCFFAETKEIEYDDIRYYKQERVIPSANDDECRTSQLPSDSVMSNDCTGFNQEWLAVAEQLYGTEFVVDFLNWLHSSEITDLHEENYGYAESDGRPLILDWAGYDR